MGGARGGATVTFEHAVKQKALLVTAGADREHYVTWSKQSSDKCRFPADHIREDVSRRLNIHCS